MSAPAPKVKQAPDVAFAMEQAEKARSRRAKAPASIGIYINTES